MFQLNILEPGPAAGEPKVHLDHREQNESTRLSITISASAAQNTMIFAQDKTKKKAGSVDSD